MKQLTEYTRVAGYLNKIFDEINRSFFESALSKPIITIQSTPRAYGHVTIGKVWESNGVERHELNIGAGTLNRPIENVVATLIHECVHLYCIANGIKDTSRGYTYHNKKFRDEATKRALHIEHDDRIGYSITSPTDELLEWCLERDLVDIPLFRQEGYAPPPKPTGTHTPISTPPAPPTTKPRTSSTRKYICPACGASVRATRQIKIYCGECAADPADAHLMHECI